MKVHVCKSSELEDFKERGAKADRGTERGGGDEESVEGELSSPGVSTIAGPNASIPHLQGNGSLVSKEGRNVIASNKEGGIEAHLEDDKSEYNALYETDEGNLKHSEAQRYQISSLALAFLRFQHMPNFRYHGGNAWEETTMIQGYDNQVL